MSGIIINLEQPIPGATPRAEISRASARKRAKWLVRRIKQTWRWMVLLLYCTYTLVIFLVVIGVVNTFHIHFAVVYFGGEGIVQKRF